MPLPHPTRPCAGPPARARLLLLLAPLLLAVGVLLSPVAAARADFQDRVDYTLTNQTGVDFSGQGLADTSFAGAVARRADFSAADLHGAILTQGDFAEADFRGADLSDALIDRADFQGADLRGALLRGVIASGSSFAGARVTDADFSEAILDRADQVDLCRRAEGRHPTTGVATRLSLGCG